MLYSLIFYLSTSIPILKIFQYFTFRSVCALFTAFLIPYCLGNRTILYLKKKQKFGQPIREDGPSSHLITKRGIPTMGGILILLGIMIGTLLWSDLSNIYIWLVISVTIGFALLGAIDDYIKLSQSNSKGLSGFSKISIQIIISLITSGVIVWLSPEESRYILTIPFFPDTTFNLNLFFFPFAVFVIIGSSNAVNLTDGLDGLATGPILFASGFFWILIYIISNQLLAKEIQLAYIPECRELMILMATVIGSSLGFLWYNAPPAQVFMGDTGSLAMGGMLGTLSILTKHELIWALVGGLFVIEAISVIIQVYYHKFTRKRFFLMAPLHHHFEKKGWPEVTIVFRFWIIAFLLSLLSLSNLRLIR